MSLPTARKILTAEEHGRVVQAAIADNDSMHYPTHVVEKDGKIVGAWGLGNVPLVMVWHKSDDISPKESMILNNNFRSIMNDRGNQQFFIACNSKSPYIDHMGRFGFKPVWPTNIFLSE